MEFFLTFLLIFVGVFWIFGRFFPAILAWYVKRRLRKMGENGAASGNSGNGGFTGFRSTGGFGQRPVSREEAERRDREEVRRSKEREGNITIIRIEEQEKVIEQGMGEYVEYEERGEQTYIQDKP